MSKSKKSKLDEWKVVVERDPHIARYTWRGKKKPDGYVAKIYRNGERLFGSEFGETREEVLALAKARKTDILEAEAYESNAEVIEL